jgi:hypothetical protein
MSYGLAIGLDVSDSTEGSPPLKLKPILANIDPEIAGKAKDIISRKTLLSLRNYRDIDSFYRRGIDLFPKIIDKFPGHVIRRIVTVAAGDDGGGADAEAVAQEVLGSVLNEKNVTPAFVLYITDDVYSKLDWQDRDNYHSSVDIAGMKAHKRYGDDSRDCFVVSPIGAPNSPIRQRADFVFEHYIKPACEATEFRARRSDMKVSQTISPEMYRALETAPLVAVYLGAPPWNPNVMVELGFRLNTKKPVFLLRDATANSEPLPFDIKDFNCIDIPMDGEITTNNDQYGAIIRRIRDFIAASPSAGWIYNYASGTYDVANGKVRIVDASGDLEDLFGERNLIQKDLLDVLSRVYGHMPKWQREKFRSEQAELIGRILIGDCEKVYATVPIYFDNHTNLKNRAFMPIIHSYSTPQAGVLRLRVVYIEVTGAIKKHQEGYYYCNLVDVPQLQDGWVPSDTVGALVPSMSPTEDHERHPSPVRPEGAIVRSGDCVNGTARAAARPN